MASVFFSFLHFFAFFALTAALVVELVLLKETPDYQAAMRIRRADRAYGISAVILLIAGFSRVLWFEKGSEYYFNNDFFTIKLGLFILVGLVSIYPTISFIKWNKWTSIEQRPEITPGQLALLKRCVHSQLALIIGVIFCAALMAKGYGM